MVTRSVYVASVVVVLVLVGGCLGGSPDGSLEGDYEQEEVDELIDEIFQAQQDSEAYDVDMRVSLSGEGQSVTIETDATVNMSAQKMRMDVDMSGAVGPMQPDEYTAYFDSDTMYMEQNGQVESVPLDQTEEDFWEAEDIAVDEAIYTYGDVHVTDQDEEIEITVELDTDQMEAALDEAESEQVGMEDVQDVEWSDVTFEQVIDPDSKLVETTTMTATMEDDERTFDYVYEMTFEDRSGESVEVSIPGGV